MGGEIGLPEVTTLPLQVRGDALRRRAPVETVLSLSTPGYQFGQAAAAATAPAPGPEAFTVDFGATRFVEETIKQQPVAMFALEWCEFCWSARKLFAALGVEYTSVDLDSVAFQADDRGGRIRKVLAGRLGVSTIPQLFVGGEHIGGCSELFEAFRSGDLQRRFRELGIDFDREAEVDSARLLPQWLHPRKSA